MGFRTLEISHAAEIHIKEGQLEITTDDGVAVVPIEDLNQIMVHGANIRLSTMDLSILSQNKVALMTLDDRYLPTAIVLPFEGHARQSKLMHAQVNTTHEKYMELWIDIIKQKISNQSRALSIMGLDGAERIAEYVATVDEENVDYCESLAAKEYFSYYHEGFNRRSEDPINSRLNYGYAVVRSAIARKLVATGFHPTFGIHHDNQLNAFNLADDLIEPYRAIKHISNHPRINPHFFAPLCSSLSNYNTLVEKSHFSKMIFILLFCRKTTSQMTLSFVFVEYTAHLCRQLWIYTNKTVRAIFMYG